MSCDVGLHCIPGRGSPGCMVRVGRQRLHIKPVTILLVVCFRSFRCHRTTAYMPMARLRVPPTTL